MLISLTVYFIYMFSISPALTFACLSTMPLLWIRSMMFAREIRPAYAESRDLMDQLVLSFAECIQGIGTIKGFALEGEATARFEADNQRVAIQRQSIFRALALYTPTMDMLTHLGMIILLGYGGWLVIHNQIPLGAGLVVFCRIAATVFESGQRHGGCGRLHPAGTDQRAARL